MAMIELQEVFKIYQSGTLQQRVETVALKGISLDINQGDFITVMGPSGSGKTTLLNVLGGLDRPSAGKIIFESAKNSIDITKLTEPQLDAFRHNKIAIIFQDENLLNHITALENVELPLKLLGDHNSRTKARDILIRLGLGDRLRHFPYQLSAGERQRVALGAALAFEPLIILADEPTGELDSATVSKVMSLFKEIHEQTNMVFFFVTHNPIVAKYGNRFFRLKDGTLTETTSVPSFEDYSAVGDYILPIDKYFRLILPDELVEELKPTDDLIRIFKNNTQQIVITTIKEHIEEGFLAQIDRKNRVLIPKEFRANIKEATLSGFYNESTKQIILVRSEK